MADQNLDETRLFDLGDEEKASEVDALIRETKSELDRLDAMMDTAPEPQQAPDEPETPKEPETPAEADEADDEPDAPEAPEKPEKPKKEKKPKRERTRLPAGIRALIYVVCVLGSAALLALAGWVCADDVLALTSPDEVVTVTVDESDTFRDVAHTLHESGLIRFEWLFRFYGWFSHAENKIDPGTYELNKVFDYHALVNGMIAGAETRATVTVLIPEGYECSRIFALLEEQGVCSAESLYRTAASYEFSYDFLSDLPYGEDNRLEGYLFPDTYQFYVDDDPVNVIDKFLRNFAAKFDDEMDAAIDDLNAMLRGKMTANGFTEAEIEAGMMDRDKIVIVASLIEKEAAISSERTKIASVIYNRLCSKLYPCLQIDATVQYALGERKENLTTEDLNISSPYNTYNNAGLPIGPIANPGLSALKAAIYPADTNYYFYALDRDGTHHFSETYYEHNDFLEGLENGND